MAFRASYLFIYVLVLHMTLVNAASFTRFVVRDTINPSTNDFQEQNGLAAQRLNAQFISLTASDACKDGSIACVKNAFAQCTGGKWTLTQCSTGLSCYALPLVNSPGTSIACDTEQDALSRIDASGASGGLFGNSTGSTPPSSVPSTSSTSTPSTPTRNSTGGQTSQHNTPGDDDCSDETGSNNGDSHGDMDPDDCNDDDTSDNYSQGGSPTNSNSGDDCDGDDGNGRTDTNENNADCDDDITSSAPEMTPTASASSTGNSQLYRRQLNFITNAGETTFVVPTRTAEPSATSSIATTVVPESSFAFSSVPHSVPTTFSSNTGLNTPPSTVTLTLVSTITVTASGGPSASGPPGNMFTTPRLQARLR